MSCVHESTDRVQQMVLDLLPERKIKGALDFIREKSGVSYWKVRKLWNPSLRKYGFSLEADEHEGIKTAWYAHLDAQEDHIRGRLDYIRQLREKRTGERELPQHEMGV